MLCFDATQCYVMAAFRVPIAFNVRRDCHCPHSACLSDSVLHFFLTFYSFPLHTVALVVEKSKVCWKCHPSNLWKSLFEKSRAMPWLRDCCWRFRRSSGMTHCGNILSCNAPQRLSDSIHDESDAIPSNTGQKYSSCIIVLKYLCWHVSGTTAWRVFLSRCATAFK